MIGEVKVVMPQLEDHWAVVQRVAESAPDLILGIDPGVNGGICLMHMITGEIVGLYPMPETQQEIVELLGEFAPRVSMVALERVQPFGGAHVAGHANIFAMFKLGLSVGFLRGALTVLQLPLEEVRPQDWQAKLGCLSKGKKAVTRQRAQQLWPVLPKGMKITNRTADACLIAEWLRRTKK